MSNRAVKANPMKSNITPKREHYTIIHVNHWGPIFTWRVVDETYGLDSWEAARAFVSQYFDPSIRFSTEGDVIEVHMPKSTSYDGDYVECSVGPSKKKKSEREIFLMWMGKYEKKPFFQGLKDYFTQYRKTSFYKAKLWFNKI